MATTWTKRLRRARGLCEQCAMPAAEGERLCDLCIEAVDLLDEPAAPRFPAVDLPPMPSSLDPAGWAAFRREYERRLRASRERLDYGDW